MIMLIHTLLVLTFIMMMMICFYQRKI